MSVIIRLQGLPWSASAMDIRQFFKGLSIPPGGVHIIGGEKGDAFIAFVSDEDARRAMMMNGGYIDTNSVKLFLSSKTEMQNVIGEARNQSVTAPVEQSIINPPQTTPQQSYVGSDHSKPTERVRNQPEDRSADFERGYNRADDHKQYNQGVNSPGSMPILGSLYDKQNQNQNPAEEFGRYPDRGEFFTQHNFNPSRPFGINPPPSDSRYIPEGIPYPPPNREIDRFSSKSQESLPENFNFNNQQPDRIHANVREVIQERGSLPRESQQDSYPPRFREGFHERHTQPPARSNFIYDNRSDYPPPLDDSSRPSFRSQDVASPMTLERSEDSKFTPFHLKQPDESVGRFNDPRTRPFETNVCANDTVVRPFETESNANNLPLRPFETRISVKKSLARPFENQSPIIDPQTRPFETENRRLFNNPVTSLFENTSHDNDPLSRSSVSSQAYDPHSRLPWEIEKIDSRRPQLDQFARQGRQSDHVQSSRENYSEDEQRNMPLQQHIQLDRDRNYDNRIQLTQTNINERRNNQREYFDSRGELPPTRELNDLQQGNGKFQSSSDKIQINEGFGNPPFNKDIVHQEIKRGGPPSELRDKMHQNSIPSNRLGGGLLKTPDSQLRNSYMNWSERREGISDKKESEENEPPLFWNSQDNDESIKSDVRCLPPDFSIPPPTGPEGRMSLQGGAMMDTENQIPYDRNVSQAYPNRPIQMPFERPPPNAYKPTKPDIYDRPMPGHHGDRPPPERYNDQIPCGFDGRLYAGIINRPPPSCGNNPPEGYDRNRVEFNSQHGKNGRGSPMDICKDQDEHKTETPERFQRQLVPPPSGQPNFDPRFPNRPPQIRMPDIGIMPPRFTSPNIQNSGILNRPTLRDENLIPRRMETTYQSPGSNIQPLIPSLVKDPDLRQGHMAKESIIRPGKPEVINPERETKLQDTDKRGVYENQFRHGDIDNRVQRSSDRDQSRADVDSRQRRGEDGRRDDDRRDRDRDRRRDGDRYNIRDDRSRSDIDRRRLDYERRDDRPRDRGRDHDRSRDYERSRDFDRLRSDRDRDRESRYRDDRDSRRSPRDGRDRKEDYGRDRRPDEFGRDRRQDDLSRERRPDEFGRDRRQDCKDTKRDDSKPMEIKTSQNFVKISTPSKMSVAQNSLKSTNTTSSIISIPTPSTMSTSTTASNWKPVADPPRTSPLISRTIITAPNNVHISGNVSSTLQDSKLRSVTKTTVTTAYKPINELASTAPRPLMSSSTTASLNILTGRSDPSTQPGILGAAPPGVKPLQIANTSPIMPKKASSDWEPKPKIAQIHDTKQPRLSQVELPVKVDNDDPKGLKRQYRQTQPSLSIIVKNLPINSGYRDVRKFFQGCEIPWDGLKMINDETGKRIGVAYINFCSSQAYFEALEKNNKKLVDNVIEIKSCKQEEYDKAVDSFVPSKENDAKKARLEEQVKVSPSKLVLNDNIVQIKGWATSFTIVELKCFLKDIKVAENGAAMYIEEDQMQRPTGMAMVKLDSEGDFKKALALDLKHLGGKTVHIKSVSIKDFECLKEQLKKDSIHKDVNAEGDVPKCDYTCVHIKGLPSYATLQDLQYTLFMGFEFGNRGIHLVQDSNGKPLGEAFAEFSCENECAKALKKDGENFMNKPVIVKPILKTEMLDLLRMTKQPSGRLNSGPQYSRRSTYYVKTENWPFTISIREVLNFFQGFNPIQETVRVQIGNDMQGSAAMVGFRSQEDADRAVNSLKNKYYRQRPIRMELALM